MGRGFLNLGPSPERIFERKEGDAKRGAVGERDREIDPKKEIETERKGQSWSQSRSERDTHRHSDGHTGQRGMWLETER